MIRLLLEFLVVLMIFRIIRALYVALFPPIDRRNGRNQSGLAETEKKTEYTDVKDAKFKDLG